jgi:hypothetical protein
MKKFTLKMLVGHRDGFGRLVDGWMDGCMGVKTGLRDCLA